MTTAPAIWSLPACAAPKRYFERGPLFDYLADTACPITDAQGRLIETSSVTGLFDRWSAPEAKAAAAYEVAHVPLSPPGSAHPLQRFLEQRLGVDALCLLDHYRQSIVPVWEWVIFGPEWISVAAHIDMVATDSWNLLIEGEKFWTMWIPAASATPKGWARSGTEGEEAAISTVQQPGDLIWIPNGVRHAVEYRQPSICWSKNLVRRANLAAVSKSPGIGEGGLKLVLQAIASAEGIPLGVEEEEVAT